MAMTIVNRDTVIANYPARFAARDFDDHEAR